MDREDIIRMAREAGAFADHLTWVERDLAPVFERFAALVAAAEREQCAKVADAWQTEVLNPRYHCDCATAIRRRGEK